MTVSENGLHSLQYNWKNIVPAAQTTTMKGPCVKTLSENEAIEKYCGEVNLKNLDVSSSISYRQVYLYQDNEVIPAWVFGTEDAFFEPVYINAITGDKLLVIQYESQDRPKEYVQNLRISVVSCRTLAHYL